MLFKILNDITIYSLFYPKKTKIDSLHKWMESCSLLLTCLICVLPNWRLQTYTKGSVVSNYL